MEVDGDIPGTEETPDGMYSWRGKDSVIEEGEEEGSRTSTGVEVTMTGTQGRDREDEGEVGRTGYHYLRDISSRGLNLQNKKGPLRDCIPRGIDRG